MFCQRVRPSRKMLLSLALVGSVACSAVAVRLWSARREQCAKMMVERVGGRVMYSYDGIDYPSWAMRLLGSEFPSHRTVVYLAYCPVTEDVLACLDRFQGLVALRLGHTPVNDENLIHISKLRDVGFLDLSSTAVSDMGLIHLQELCNLEVLLLYDTGVTDRGVTLIQSLHSSIEVYTSPGHMRVPRMRY
jgi:hypothetical protein